MLHAAGLSDDGVDTPDVWGEYDADLLERLPSIGGGIEDRGDIIIAAARKISLPLERYPSDLYR